MIRRFGVDRLIASQCRTKRKYMGPIRLDFGYYPEPMDLSVGNIKVETLPGLGDTVRAMESDLQVHDGWIYAPPQQTQHLGAGICQRPFPTRVFGLRHT